MQATEIQFVSHLNSHGLWKELGPSRKGKLSLMSIKTALGGHFPFGENISYKRTQHRPVGTLAIRLKFSLKRSSESKWFQVNVTHQHVSHHRNTFSEIQLTLPIGCSRQGWTTLQRDHSIHSVQLVCSCLQGRMTSAWKSVKVCVP